MKNLLKRFKERRADRREDAQQNALVLMMQYIDGHVAEQRIIIDRSQRRVFITIDLAHERQKHPHHWRAFLKSIDLYMSLLTSNDLAEQHYVQAETEALAHYRRKVACVFARDMVKVREQARLEAKPLLIDGAPTLSGFDFVLLSHHIDHPQAHIVVVGRYTEADITMVPYNAE